MSLLVKANNDTFRGNSGNEGEQRLKFIAAKVLPHSYAEENKMLLKRLKIYGKNSGYSNDADMIMT